jgi:hypothetical protein
MFRALAFVAMLAGFAGPLAAFQQGPPGDLEVRTSRDPLTNDTLTTLTLMLKGPKGPLPVNVAIVKRRPAQAEAGSPTDVRLQFDFPLFVGQPDYGRPHVVLTLDKGARNEETGSYNAEPAAIIPGETQIRVRYSASALGRLAKAARVEGRVLGVEFVLTPEQLRAIRNFAGRTSSSTH